MTKRNIKIRKVWLYALGQFKQPVQIRFNGPQLYVIAVDTRTTEVPSWEKILIAQQLRSSMGGNITVQSINWADQSV